MKPEVVFGLEGAAWPALLLNAGGVVLRANAAGTNTFGAALAGESPPLSAIWSPENGQKPEEFFVALGEITDRDGGFEISRCERRNDEIHSGDLHFQFGGPQVVCFAIIARGCAGVGNRPGSFRRCPRPGRNQNRAGRGRCDAQAKTGVRVATGAVGVAGFQQRADEHSRSHVVAVEQGRGGASVAAFADGGGKIGGARGGDRQRTHRVQPSGKGSAPLAAGKFEHGGEPLRGFFPRRAWRQNHVEDAIGAGIVLGAI